MKTFVWKDLSPSERRTALARPENRRDATVLARVRDIFDDIEARGFEAVCDWAIRLDGHAPNRIELDARTVDAARAQ
jgi:histidinol dehydrogenase